MPVSADVNPFALQPASRSADAVRLAQLELQLAEREADLAGLKAELQSLQSRYLDDLGPYYRDFGRLEAEIFDLEVDLGIRPPAAYDEGQAAEGADGVGCATESPVSDDLKRMFRDVAKAVHPDLASDEMARFRAHSLMAEANRAYAERDADRLRLILHTWAHGADAALEDDGDEDGRIARRLARIDERLLAIEAEFAELRRSAIWRLKGRIDAAKAQGWDLFGEMVLQVKREIAQASRRLQILRQTPRA